MNEFVGQANNRKCIIDDSDVFKDDYDGSDVTNDVVIPDLFFFIFSSSTFDRKKLVF